MTSEERDAATRRRSRLQTADAFRRLSGGSSTAASTRAPVFGLELDIDLADDLNGARSETMNALGIAQAELIWQPDTDASAS